MSDTTLVLLKQDFETPAFERIINELATYAYVEDDEVYLHFETQKHLETFVESQMNIMSDIMLLDDCLELTATDYID